jgi:type I restriction enzyme S subunit
MLLGDVVRFGNGRAIKPGGEGRYPVYGSNGIIGGCDEFRYENGVIIGRVGAYCGAVLYCPEKFWASDNTLVAFPANDGFDTKFLFYLLHDTKLSNYAGGAAQPLVTQTVLKQVKVSVPPLPVQRRIAGILSAYDELMENSQRRIRLLEAMARALYREWFVHFRFPGHEKHPRVASPLGDIPQGWEVKPLESLLIDHIGGGWGKDVADEDHTEPAWVIRGTDIPDARSSRVADVPHRFHTVSNLRTRRLQAGDILFEVSGGSKGQPVGRALLVTPQLLSALGDESVICASFCKRVRPDAAGYGSELLYLSFVEGYESGEIEQFQVQSTGISNFKWTEYIAKTERAVPPAPLRVSFRDRVAPLFSQIATLGLQIQNLRRTRDLLLPRLLSGQVHLPAVEGSEAVAGIPDRN